MIMDIKGYAHTYRRDHINTDEIIPARYLVSDSEPELAKHAMEDIDKEFVDKVRTGDFIVASSDFGCGSSREHAVWALRGAGVQAVIADSFARIFFRNAINNGFIVIECPGASKKIDSGDELEIDLEGGKIINRTKGKEYDFNPFPPFVLDMFEKGGLLNKILGD
ncbi:MAG TPA: 3-isopropylmalate dehydratase small subunit [Candidatus Methanofastidiosa archaeon]|nr:3-isopropylmalate dehydratase small subunit [Candidatus Methanofastidiosa archaeon]